MFLTGLTLVAPGLRRLLRRRRPGVAGGGRRAAAVALAVAAVFIWALLAVVSGGTPAAEAHGGHNHDNDEGLALDDREHRDNKCYLDMDSNGADCPCTLVVHDEDGDGNHPELNRVQFSREPQPDDPYAGSDGRYKFSIMCDSTQDRIRAIRYSTGNEEIRGMISINVGRLGNDNNAHRGDLSIQITDTNSGTIKDNYDDPAECSLDRPDETVETLRRFHITVSPSRMEPDDLDISLLPCTEGSGELWIENHQDKRITPRYTIATSKLADNLMGIPGGEISAQLLLALVSAAMFWGATGFAVRAPGGGGAAGPSVQPYAGIAGMMLGALIMPVFGYGEWWLFVVILFLCVIGGYAYLSTTSARV